MTTLRPALLALAFLTTPALFAQPTGLPSLPSMPATISTSVPVQVFEKSIQALQGDTAAQVRSLRATLTETRTAQVPGLADALGRQTETLERLRNVFGQQVSALRELGTLEASRGQISEQMTALRSSGPPEPGPYSILRLDQLEAERTLETARGPPLDASAGTSLKQLQEAERSLLKARQQRQLAELALAGNADPTRIPTLRAEFQAADVDVRLAEETYRFRELDSRTDQLAVEVHRLRQKLSEERLEWVRRSVTFSQEDLEQQVFRGDKEAFDLQRTLDATRLEISAAERRWTALRQAVDAATDPTDLQREELQTRFLDLQARQRETVLIEARLQRIRDTKKLWQDRYLLTTEAVEIPAVRDVVNQCKSMLEGLEREWQLQSSRLVELQREQTALKTQLDALPTTGDGPRLARLLRDRTAALERMSRAGGDNLSSIEALRDLARRLLAEGRAWLRAVTAGSLSVFLRGKLGDLWGGWLQPMLGPMVRILFLLFACIPLNLLLSRRAQTTLSRLYSPQTGMIAAKLVYYGGLVLILIFLLNTLGIGLAPLVGAAGVTGVAIGFASQTSISNIISGIFLIAEQPFQVGEVITVGDITGAVLSIDLLSVKLRQFDNKFTRIPNETILRSNLTNISRHPIRRIEMDVSVAYRTDLSAVEALLLELAHEHPEVLESPEPMVIWTGYGDSGINVRLNSWVVRDNFLKTKNEIFKEVKRRFDAAGIEIPFPHLSLYRGTATEPMEIRLVQDPAATGVVPTAARVEGATVDAEAADPPGPPPAPKVEPSAG